ncbi:MAG: iron-sulfur cluster repair di-iron protein [Bacteroidetes bacterium]|nr:iron-sulfur cluster repair di-iron protein [Bacteroidota bacterium]MBS1932443.1 iron-sulfur cluster repair di-iron protein [Bacteroidota bacterium]
MNNYSEQTLAQIASANHHAVPVFEKYHLDFCCKGKRKLAEACRDECIEMDQVVEELNLIGKNDVTKGMPFDKMTTNQLISHIVTRHHYYIKNSMPVISSHLEKVAAKHGERFPYMVDVFHLFSELQKEMTMHIQKEELVLFPRLMDAEKRFANADIDPAAFEFITAPIAMMEKEHEHGGTIMDSIRRITNGYTIPAGACMTFKVCLQELKEFEEDLHEHVHLENNLLFPKIQGLIKGSRKIIF